MKDQTKRENELSHDRLEGQIQNWINKKEREKKEENQKKQKASSTSQKAGSISIEEK